MNETREPKIPEQKKKGSSGSGEPVFLAVGKLRRPHALQGEMLMDIETDFPERLRVGKTVYVGETHTPLRIRSIRPQDRALLLAFDGYMDSDQAGTLRNQMVYVRADELPDLPEGEYYFHQLIGLRVVDENGRELGLLSDILETGANDVYVVKDENGAELLLPAIEDVIIAVDLENHLLRVHPQEWS